MGGSSGGGGLFARRTVGELRELVDRQEHKTRDAAFAADLAGVLGELLGGYNARDTLTANERLEDVKASLADEMEGSFDSLYGGSVAKHTYVDGLSDVDSLVIINDSALEGMPPSEVLRKMAETIANQVGDEGVVTHGKMAVTITYSDGMILQVLPAIKSKDDKLRVPSSRRDDSWSKIDPVGFNRALTKANSQCSGKLIPTIKLAKAIVSNLPKTEQLTGYHIESLAIKAFRGYEGEKTTSAMLQHFFASSQDFVLSPIKDSSGQSLHVDGYLGKTNSSARGSVSRALGRIERKMRNATRGESVAQWRALFRSDDE